MFSSNLLDIYFAEIKYQCFFKHISFKTISKLNFATFRFSGEPCASDITDEQGRGLNSSSKILPKKYAFLLRFSILIYVMLVCYNINIQKSTNSQKLAANVENV